MLLALLLTILAGMATLIGGFLAMHKRFIQRDMLAMALGFAAGAMLLVSFVEMLPAAQQSIAKAVGDHAMAITFAAFFAGMLLVAVIDKLLPHSVNPSEHEGSENRAHAGLNLAESRRLMRSGLLLALAIGLHNFPEGLVTFIGALENPQLGIALAVAIAIHNIPEGIAVAAPIYAATKSRKKAFWYTALSGVSEPLGALAGYIILAAILPVQLLGVAFAVVAGMMVFICLDELLPAARRYETSSHQTIYGAVAGMGVMALSLVLLQY